MFNVKLAIGKKETKLSQNLLPFTDEWLKSLGHSIVRQMEFNVKNGNFCNINEIYFKKLGKINRCYGKKAPGQSYGENIEIK